MSVIPLIFVHTGYQKHLDVIIPQAEQCNEQVYLLGDSSNKNTAKQWFNIEDYIDARYEIFRDKFVNMSSNSAEFELNCFKRYFVCYQFAKAKSIDKFFMVDSDCLVYENLSNLDLQEYDAGASVPENQSNMSWTASPHSSLWSMNALNDFLEYLIKAYDEDNMDSLLKKWKYHQECNVPGGICDMTLLYLWMQNNANRLKLFNGLCIKNGKTFDHFLHVSEGYSVGDFEVNSFLEMKIIKFIDGKPYFKYKDGTWIQSCTIHAQGARKKYISILNPNQYSLLNCYKRKLLWDYNRVRNYIKRKIFNKK